MSISNLFSPNTYNLYSGSICPSLTTSQRVALAPSNGTLVYDSTEGSLYIYSGGWVEVIGGTVTTTPKAVIWTITNNFSINPGSAVGIAESNTQQLASYGGLSVNSDGVFVANLVGLYRFSAIVDITVAPGTTGIVSLIFANSDFSLKYVKQDYSTVSTITERSLSYSVLYPITVVGSEISLWIQNNLTDALTLAKEVFPLTVMISVEYLGN